MTKKRTTAKTKKLPLNFMQIGALADAFKSHPMSIIRWINSGDQRLTSDLAKQTLARVEKAL